MFCTQVPYNTIIVNNLPQPTVPLLNTPHDCHCPLLQACWCWRSWSTRGHSMHCLQGYPTLPYPNPSLAPNPAGVLVLEELEHARARGAPILAEYIGGSFTCDAHHMTEPLPDGTGVGRCIAMCAAPSAWLAA